MVERVRCAKTAEGKAIFVFFTCGLIGILVGLLKRTSVEDVAMKENFGEEWAEWAPRVPYSLIPWVY
jgi:protein-S-isoprenylcysteine O-methyltransferase Ste14